MKKITVWKEKLYFIFFESSAILSIFFLFLVLFLLLLSGYSVISLKFLFSTWNHVDILQGGVIQAIVGSLYIGIGVMVISFPLGIGTAIYLSEYSEDTIWTRIIQIAIRNLAGVPSVVYGMFGLAVFVSYFSLGTSLASAILTLSVMTLPWIISTSVEAFESIPIAFRESSLALGASQWQTIYKIVLPAALPNCITGGIIGNARALGETAPIILVGATFYITGFPVSPLDKFMALSYHTFILATQHSSQYAASYAAGTALVLITLTFFLSFTAIFIRYYYRKRKEW